MESKDSLLPSGQAATITPLLPLWTTVGNAYRTAWCYRAEYIKIIWCWLVLIVPITCLYCWIVWPSIEPLLCVDYARLPKGAALDAIGQRALIALLPQSVLRILIGASIAVAWHRLILRHEKIANAPYLRLDGLVLDYFTFGLCFWLLSMLNSIVSTMFTNHMFFKAFLMIAVSFTVIILIIRLSIILPARALELKNVTLKDVWQKTKGNFWRIMCGTMLSSLPLVPFHFLTKMGCGSSIAGPIASSISTLFGIVIVMPVMLAFLSLSYQHFFERHDIA